jgi:multicomponent Na+:H+ antiporter subunit E
MGEILAILAVALLWSFLNGELSWANTAVGVFLGMLLLSVLQRNITRSLPRRVLGLLRYLGHFFIELVRAGIRLSRLAVTPRPRFHPHVIAVPLRVESNGAITLLALTISLIPGTVPMGVSPDRKFLYAHSIDERDPDDSREGIIRIETRILEFVK